MTKKISTKTIKHPVPATHKTAGTAVGPRAWGTSGKDRGAQECPPGRLPGSLTKLGPPAVLGLPVLPSHFGEREL